MPYTISVFGNCQANGIADCLAAMLPSARILPGFARDIREGLIDFEKTLSQSDVVVTLTSMRARVTSTLKDLNRTHVPVIVLPTIYYTGFHPDFIHVAAAGRGVKSPVGSGNSAIALAGWLDGLSVEQTVSLFRREIFEHLGYLEYDRQAESNLLSEAKGLGFDLDDEMRRWRSTGCFVYAPNHPKINVLASLARATLGLLDVKPTVQHVEQLIPDLFAANVSWPVYPELAAKLGVPGEYVFKPASGSRKVAAPLRTLDLEAFVRGSFESYAEIERDQIEVARFEDRRYHNIGQLLGRTTSHPYKGLPDYQFWNRTMVGEASKVDPVARPGHPIQKNTLIATAGSCFAQHIARALSKSGYSYYVAEDAEGLEAEEASKRQYGLFSARYGNIYTGEQLAQLFDRADGDFAPVDDIWERPDGRLVDAFRPQVEPEGFATRDELLKSRTVHLEAVRKMLRELDVFVFTLGLTEAWRSRSDGAVYPLAPGVSAGRMDPEKYEFHNYTVEETTEAMERALNRLWRENPDARVILTVSPVPLAATYEARHVLQSTTYSKSVLRIVAEQLRERHQAIEYFPSFEIITGAFSRGAYFEEDLRTVTPEGVAHVMRLFMQHHAQEGEITPPPPPPPPVAEKRTREQQEGEAVVCEEELLARA